MSSFEVYQGGEPLSWRAYDNSNYDSYYRPYHSGRHGIPSLVPSRVIARGHVDRKQKTDAFWDRSDNCINYVVYPGADDYHRLTSDCNSYDYNSSYGQTAPDDYGTETYDYHRRTSSFNDHDPYGRSAAYRYSYSTSPQYTRHFDRSSFEYSRHNDQHHYRSETMLTGIADVPD